jgi:hypothetical protein
MNTKGAGDDQHDELDFSEHNAIAWVGTAAFSVARSGSGGLCSSSDVAVSQTRETLCGGCGNAGFDAGGAGSYIFHPHAFASGKGE